MKLIYTLLFVALSFVSFGQNLNPYTASQRLQDAVNDNPDAFHKVLFLFTDRVDALAMNEDFYARNLSLSDRNVELFSALKEKANTIQAPYLQAFQASSQVKDVRSFWISNIIYAEVTGEYLAELSHDTAIDFMDLSVPLAIDEYTSTPIPLPPVPNGTELGLRTIKADSLWAMGYTGYGRSALINDTGIDGTHPALMDKFSGNCTDIDEAWFDFDTDYPIDFDDHGTHVTGTILGLDRQTNDTIGVAFNAQWLGAPTLGGSVSNIGSFQWSLDPDGDPSTTEDMPDVINNSWWDPSAGDCSNIYTEIFNTVEATKVAIVFSAGNAGPDAETITTPKNINTSLVNSFTVGALSGSNSIADFSSRGPSRCPGEGSLAIKPEVSAPGSFVRSCVPGADYDMKSGTSMAAPHTSGAILLLREAFPNTTGTEVKMALYMSATDIGELGEDNTFGMGRINVPAAYDYLIEQGHTPEPPTPKERDIIAVNLDLSPVACPDNFVFVVSFENNGAEPLTDLTIEYTVAGLSGNYQWSGNLLPGEISSVSLAETDIPAGAHELQIILSEPNGLMDDRPLNNKIKRLVDITNDTPLVVYAEGNLDNYCEASEVHLRVDYQGIGDVDVTWYDALYEGNSIGSGSVFNIGVLEETQTFYAEANYLWPAGKTSLGFNSDVAEVDNPGIQFDAFQDFKLNSVLVYFETTGGRLIRLENASGQEIDTKIVNVTGDGQKRVTLNFDIPQGNNYRLTFQQGAPLLSDMEGAQFPYILDDVVRLDRSLAVNSAQSLVEYHCFYDWEIELPTNCGRLPLTVNAVPGDNIPLANFTSSISEIDLTSGDLGLVEFTNTSESATSFIWNFSDGTTDETNESPTHVFSEAGTYTVSLTVFNADGCSDTHTTEIVVSGQLPSSSKDFTIPQWDITLFPNPTQDKLMINFALEETQNLTYKVVDIYGRNIISSTAQDYSNAQISIDMSKVSAGIYYVVFENKEQQLVKKVVKM
jgi:subtilisin family serine protease/PKD repeat protein